MNRGKITIVFLYLTAFIVGAVGTVVEFSAVRLVAPFFGSSMDTWAIIVAVIMTALALGYSLGGFLSKRIKNKIRTIYGIVGIAGLFVSVSFFLVEPIVTFTSYSLSLIQTSLSLNTFIVVFSLFFFPVFLLGSICPLIIALKSDYGQDEVTGMVLALSTFGSIFGSLLPSFVLFPMIGTRLTFFLTGILLECIAFLGLSKWYKIFPLFVLSLYVFYIPYINAAARSTEPNVIFQTESMYQPIKVIKQNDTLLLSLGSNSFLSSIYSPNTFITKHYFDYFALLPLLRHFDHKLNILIVGLAGGTISREIDHFYRESYDLSIDGVEIDPEVVKVAKQYLGLNQSSLTIYEMDGRRYINQTGEKYDIIIIDVYARQSYIPFHLSTQEFIQRAKEHLKDSESLLVFNISSNTKDSFRLKALSHTTRSVFNNTYVLPLPNANNYMVLASLSEISIPLVFDRERLPSELSTAADLMVNANIESIDKVKESQILLDDTAPEKM